jgi:hypothetical protein
VAAPMIEPELGRSANAQPHRTPLQGEPELVEATPERALGFEGADPDSDDVDRALLTYAAGGVGGRYIPREASSTVARLRPREEGTTPGFSSPGPAPKVPGIEAGPVPAPQAAKCPVPHGESA